MCSATEHGFSTFRFPASISPFSSLSFIHCLSWTFPPQAWVEMSRRRYLTSKSPTACLTDTPTSPAEMILWHPDDFLMAGYEPVVNITRDTSNEGRDNECAAALVTPSAILGMQDNLRNTVKINLIILFQALLFFANHIGPLTETGDDSDFWDVVVREWRLSGATPPRWVAKHAAFEYSQSRRSFLARKEFHDFMYRDATEGLLLELIDKWICFMDAREQSAQEERVPMKKTRKKGNPKKEAKEKMRPTEDNEKENKRSFHLPLPLDDINKRVQEWRTLIGELETSGSLLVISMPVGGNTAAGRAIWLLPPEEPVLIEDD
ncbi:hypothetical protein B0T22DRAFT_462942 [Podospora appendiculata]|uniref:Uncharacterized protein n=1 Tax=Podospora appendiculata TaxID=314037 RepID=A0AAE0XCJ7_9PEZI|nr:hypothetical protein B0T22DRAFT_462942 [Podospora appendiculata]